jgi:predicted CopG family antitoxin
MGKRINIMIDEDTWRILGRIPAGARSRAVNEALRTWVQRRRRNDAVNELDALRAQLPAASAAEVAQWIREDREQGH